MLTGVLCLLIGLPTLIAADFWVASPGFFYSINGTSPNPTLTSAIAQGRGDGRIYTITVDCEDGAGIQVIGEVTVTVPHHVSP